MPRHNADSLFQIPIDAERCFGTRYIDGMDDDEECLQDDPEDDGEGVEHELLWQIARSFGDARPPLSSASEQEIERRIAEMDAPGAEPGIPWEVVRETVFGSPSP